tara:strand:- start:140 stop:559 length:420 start_codon:yes stop_codon:yes gene_type:complete
MFGLPHLTRCPCCAKSNFVILNKVAQDHNFKSLENYILRKKFKCKKCGEEIGLFLSDSNEEKVLWLNLFLCEENYHSELTKLKQKRAKLNTTKVKSFNNISEKFHLIEKEINEIEKKIQSEKIRLKIKLKIQKRVDIPN